MTNESFNADFGMATDKFIELKSEESRQKQFDDSLIKIKDTEGFHTDQLMELILSYIVIANADDFIHENEVILIQHAITIWELDIIVEKPKSGEKLKIQE